MDGAMFWTLAVLAAVLVGMGKGGMPVVGMLSVPVLALVMSPVTAAGLLLPVYVVSDMFGLWAYRHEFNARVIWIILPGAMAVQKLLVRVPGTPGRYALEIDLLQERVAWFKDRGAAAASLVIVVSEPPVNVLGGPP